MDFQLSEDQQALKEGVRTFCDGRISADQLRELADLEERRRRGLIDEANYRSRRDQILDPGK